MTIAELIKKYGVSIETSRVWEDYPPSIPINYTLIYQGRKIRGERRTEKTITCEVALTGMFNVADSGDMPGLYKAARRDERGLKYLLRDRYEEFHQAFLADTRYQRRR